MNSEELSFLLQTDNIKHITENIGKEPWITVYERIDKKSEHGAYFCALIPNDWAEKVINTLSWEFHLGSGLPGHSVRHTAKGKIVQYHRFGDSSGIEPLVFVRNFHGIRPSYIEIGEEFRLFHKLYYEANSNVYMKITDSGNEEETIRITDYSAEIKLKALRQFLAVKDMCLAIYFDIVRHSGISINEIDPALTIVDSTDKDLHYDLYVREWNSQDEYLSFSRLLGKKLIRGVPKEKSGVWPYEEEKQEYVKFIVGINQDGEEVEFTSNPDTLSNNSETNLETPDYLTPIFFRREVLNKYYANPQKYTVEDGYLRCGGLWIIQIDNNLEKSVVVFLGDLGRDLPYEDQIYWRSFNIPPEGRISEVNFRRSFLAEFADPSGLDLRFKFRFQSFQSQWYKKYGWYLFMPLNEDDAHIFSTLRLPLTNDQAEFDVQVLALSKILIDSINERELECHLPRLEPNTKGITKLQQYLEQEGLKKTDKEIAFVRNLWELRSSGIGHRKGSNYYKIAKKFGVGQKPLTSVFKDILTEAVNLIDKLEAQLLNSTSAS